MAQPKRTETHRIDTRAVRSLLQHLPEDWLVRSLEERDYGVDLQIEIFKGDLPTGRVALIQVKGRRESFGPGAVSLGNFPTKTVEYAALFSAPFFVFHTSIEDNRTHFVWLQKYAETKLVDTTPNWRDQDSVTLYFPPANLLQANSEKIEQILIRHALQKDCFTYLGCCEWLQRHIDQVAHGNIDALEPALNQLARIDKLNVDFHARYLGCAPDLDFNELRDSLEALRYRPDDQDELAVVDRQMEYMTASKGLILDQDALDAFTVQNASSDAYPY